MKTLLLSLNPYQVLALVAMAMLCVYALGCVVAAGLRWLVDMSVRRLRRTPATFIGLQEMLRGPPVELYNLTADIPGHPRGSTVSRQTLEAHGYKLGQVMVVGGNRGGKSAAGVTTPIIRSGAHVSACRSGDAGTSAGAPSQPKAAATTCATGALPTIAQPLAASPKGAFGCGDAPTWRAVVGSIFPKS